jgi:hypothetical protein
MTANAVGETEKRRAINASGFTIAFSLAAERDLLSVLLSVGLNMVFTLWF